jgi:hypothetical protein
MALVAVASLSCGGLKSSSHETHALSRRVILSWYQEAQEGAQCPLVAISAFIRKVRQAGPAAGPPLADLAVSMNGDQAVLWTILDIDKNHETAFYTDLILDTETPSLVRRSAAAEASYYHYRHVLFQLQRIAADSELPADRRAMAARVVDLMLDWTSTRPNESEEGQRWARDERLRWLRQRATIPGTPDATF